MQVLSQFFVGVGELRLPAPGLSVVCVICLTVPAWLELCCSCPVVLTSAGGCTLVKMFLCTFCTGEPELSVCVFEPKGFLCPFSIQQNTLIVLAAVTSSISVVLACFRTE